MDKDTDKTTSAGSSLTSRTGSRSTFRETSTIGCGFSSFTSFRTEKQDVARLAMPQYLRLAMLDSIRKQDVDGGDQHFQMPRSDDDPCCETPVVVLINPKSGGRHGPVLKERLQHLISEEQVFDLHDVNPHEFVRYGLACLEKWAENGDSCAKETRMNIRVIVAGGDGTVGWVLGCLGELHKKGRFPVPPVAIIPLGTGNDLSRSFGWGGSFPFSWKSAIKRTLQRATTGPICHLDSWHVVVQMPGGEVVDPPHSLKATEECGVDQIEGHVPHKLNFYEGVFYNYFSIGMDAQVAFGFHRFRNEKPFLAQGPISNKIIYSGYTCTQGWFLTPCISDPTLRLCSQSLGDGAEAQNIECLKCNSTWLRFESSGEGVAKASLVLRAMLKGHCSEWEPITVPESVRAIVALNLPSYGSGRNPWGNLKPEYLEKRGFVETHVDDGLLEIFGLKQGWHASFVMVELISAKHIAQAASIQIELRGGEWKEAFFQMDGEPWKQPMSSDYSTIVEIKRVPFQSVMISGE
ncbi:Diacylglycerol kinase 3 [Hibiscus syriacus]|uniref:Diacylglycerol kinase n=1 Tax=Hibiscus syriacus TaxID=106335 RepID=A0A6A3A557_HIBSY|nr:Diacylglycerol kinase 3 [Hibiscus syriacus]